MTIIATQPLRASLAVDRGGEGAAATNGGGDAGWGTAGDGLTEGDHVGDDQVGGMAVAHAAVDSVAVAVVPVVALTSPGLARASWRLPLGIPLCAPAQS